MGSGATKENARGCGTKRLGEEVAPRCTGDDGGVDADDECEGLHKPVGSQLLTGHNLLVAGEGDVALKIRHVPDEVKGIPCFALRTHDGGVTLAVREMGREVDEIEPECFGEAHGELRKDAFELAVGIVAVQTHDRSLLGAILS